MLTKEFHINELVEEIQNAINYEVSIDYNLTKPAGVSKKTLNGSNGSQILKWEPEWSLSEGINETTKWYLEKATMDKVYKRNYYRRKAICINP